jgi:hypothetical protein
MTRDRSGTVHDRSGTLHDRSGTLHDRSGTLHERVQRVARALSQKETGPWLKSAH